MDWFLHDAAFRHERVKSTKWTRDKETCAEGMVLQSYFVSEYTFLISENNNHTNKQ